MPNPVYTSVIKNSLIKTKISSELKCNQNQGKTKEEGNIGEKISIELPKDSNYDAARCAVSKSPLSRDLFNEINLKVNICKISVIFLAHVWNVRITNLSH